jgi:hypothetical protein
MSQAGGPRIVAAARSGQVKFLSTEVSSQLSPIGFIVLE